MINRICVATYIHKITINTQVLRGHCRNDGKLSDYCDGSVYRQHPLFSIHENSLEIMLYVDDVEVCNPLGSHAKTHKLSK